MNLLKKKIKYYEVKKPCKKITSSELNKGIKIELEHTKDKKIARAIALAHICDEYPKYYTKGLIPMEKRLKKLKGGKLK